MKETINSPLASIQQASTGLSGSSVAMVQRVGTGLSMILLPIILFVGFATHPNLGSLELLNDTASWVAEFRHNTVWLYAHMAVLFSTPLFIVVALGLKRLLAGKADWHALIGGSFAVIGTLLLAADKGALGLVPGALESLSDKQFTQAMPAVEAMFTKAGPLALLTLLPLLMIGFVILGVGLFKVPAVSRWKSATLVIAFLMFLNPDIDLISAIASVVLLVGLGSIGMDYIKGKLE